LLAGGTATAAVTLPLHSSQRGATAPQFASADCVKDGEVPPAGTDRWVFVLPHHDADFVSLTLTFKTDTGTTTTVKIPDSSDPYPDGITSNGTSKAWAIVPSGWTLLDGSATVSGATKATYFNLTHTCPGPSPSPSASTSSSSTSSPPASRSNTSSADTSASAAGSEEGAASSSSAASTPSTGALPTTGTAIAAMVLTGGSAVGSGAALLWWRRRRDRVVFTAE
jgi:LPXTG-motif cell wall-anchored protein